MSLLTAARMMVPLAMLLYSFAAAAQVAPAPTPVAAPSPGPAQTATQPPLVTWAIDTGFDVGFKALYTTTSGSGTDTTHANSGLFFSAGIVLAPLLADRLRTRATIGVKYIGQDYSNGDINYYSFPFELVEMVRLHQSFSMGAGLYAHLAPRISGSGDASELTTHFDTSPGFVLRADFGIPSMGLGARFIWNKLTANGVSLNAPAIGFYLAFAGG